MRATLLVRTAFVPAASFTSLPHVRVTGFRRRLLNFGVRLTANKDNRVCEIKATAEAWPPH
jgi:hypothetical protein